MTQEVAQVSIKLTWLMEWWDSVGVVVVVFQLDCQQTIIILGVVQVVVIYPQGTKWCQVISKINIQ